MLRTVQLSVYRASLIVCLLVMLACRSGYPELLIDAHDNGNGAPELVLLIQI
jgi:hypothetical protein